MAWDGERPEITGWIRQEIARRLLATGSVLDNLREQVKEDLAVAGEIPVPPALGTATPEVSRPSSSRRYESAIGSGSAGTPEPAMGAEGPGRHQYPRQKGRGNFWKVLAPLDLALFEQTKAFSTSSSLDGDAGEEAHLAFDDLRYRDSPNPGRAGYVCGSICNS